jgi:hypothetical protein
MKTFILCSDTNYDLSVTIVNAESEEEVRNLVKDNKYVWLGYNINEIDTKTKGIVFQDPIDN